MSDGGQGAGAVAADAVGVVEEEGGEEDDEEHHMREALRLSRMTFVDDDPELAEVLTPRSIHDDPALAEVPSELEGDSHKDTSYPPSFIYRASICGIYRASINRASIETHVVETHVVDLQSLNLRVESRRHESRRHATHRHATHQKDTQICRPHYLLVNMSHD